MRKALYRKWRPATFEDVVGQEVITKTLQNQIETDKIVHAYLFTGSRGTGKTTCSKILAKAINCKNPHNGNPCGECDFCLGIEDGSILDVIEMDAASNNKVDDIRLLKEEINYTPSQLKYRVYIIDEVHMLSTSAFNALLKVMEEPPSYVVFILATTELHKVPATILSRCQRFDFKRITPTDIGSRLLFIAGQEGIQLDEKAARLIGVLSDGGMRDAISLLDLCCATTNEVTESLVRQVAGVGDRLSLFEMLAAIGGQDTATALLTLQKMYTGSADAKRITEQLLEVFRDLMLYLSTKDPQSILDCSEEELVQFENLSKTIDINTCITCIELLGGCYDKMGASFQKRTLLEMTLIKMCTLGQEIAVAARPARAVSKPVPAVTGQRAQLQETDKPSGVMEPTQETTENTLGETTGAKLQTGENKGEIPAATQTANVSQEVSAEKTAAPATAPVSEIESGAGKEGQNEAKKEPPAPLLSDHGEYQKIENWNEVVEMLRKTNPAVYGHFMGTGGYLKDDIVYIQAGGMLFTLLKGNQQAKASVEEAIAEVLGKKHRIDRFTEDNAIAAKTDKGQSAVDDILKKAKELGVECED